MIRSQVSAYLMDQVYANVDVARRDRPARCRRGSGRSPAPPPTACATSPRSGPTTRCGDRGSSRLWKDGQPLTAQQFINIAEGKSGAITSSGNAVVLDLRVVVLEPRLAARPAAGGWPEDPVRGRAR